MKRPCMTMTAVLCGLGAAGAVFADPPKVTSVTLAQPQGSRAAVVSYQTDGPGIATFSFMTNGAPLAGVAWTVTGEISRYIPDAGPHAFTWDAGRDIPEHLISNLTCEVTLWATNAPPPYAAVNLVADAASGQFPVRFWGSEGEVPLGVANGRWKKDWLLLRQIPSTEGGTVTLGSPDYEIGRNAANEAERTVRITAPFYLGVYPVTQVQWERVGTRTAPSKWNNVMWRDERPVEQVSWYDIRSSASGNVAVAGTDWPTNGHAVGEGSFMHALRAKTGGLLEFDLPTAAQWEYACRAGTTGAWNNGTSSTNNASDANLGLLGRYTRNGGYINTTGATWVEPDDVNALGSAAAVTASNATAIVGTYLPNAWGLYDMHGNVWEWCLDWYAASDASLSGDDPQGPPTGTTREERGGSYSYNAQYCRSSRRNTNAPTGRSRYIGFRIAAPAAVDMSAGQ